MALLIRSHDGLWLNLRRLVDPSGFGVFSAQRGQINGRIFHPAFLEAPLLGFFDFPWGFWDDGLTLRGEQRFEPLAKELGAVGGGHGEMNLCADLTNHRAATRLSGPTRAF